MLRVGAPPTRYHPPMESAPIEVIYDDGDLLAVAKPSGVACVPARDEDPALCLRARVAAQLGVDVLPVHRLDRGTSGVMLFARTPAMHRAMNGAFAARRVSKTYLACVAGMPPSDRGTRDRPLVGLDGPRGREAAPGAPGTEASTRWAVTAVFDDGVEAGLPGRRVTVLRVSPETGRRHQLRIHLAGIGCPMVGDPLYAPPEVASAWPRLCLHALEIRFQHPTLGTTVELKVSPPNDLPRLMRMG